jgi:hypothetical protein
MPSMRARVWVTSLTLAAVVMTLNGVPRPSQIKVCLLPVFRRSTGDGPVPAPPFFRADVGAVHARPGPIELPRRVELGEQDPVQLVEDTGLLPPLHPAPAGLTGAEPQRQRQQLPGYVVVQDLQDALAGKTGRAPAEAPATVPARAAAAARSAPTSRRPRSTAPHRAAVERTVPFGLYCYTITVAWYALHGHQPGDVAEHRQRAPWYTTKTDPSLSDMIAKLRRVIIAARCMPTRPGQPTEQEIRTVQQAWAAASTNAAA